MINQPSSQKLYHEHDEHFKNYIDYQQKYKHTVRESDKILIDKVSELFSGSPLRVLDIGCSTGNLLLHLKNKLPALELYGGDLNKEQVDLCKSSDDLKGIHFSVLDICDLPLNSYDIVIANAIFFNFNQSKFSSSLASINSSLRQGGKLLAFDFVHPWIRDVEVKEFSDEFPDGLSLFMRSEKTTHDLLEQNKFKLDCVNPFRISIDLKQPEFNSPRNETYTIHTVDDYRLLMRGVINQPWAHFTASKKN